MVVFADGIDLTTEFYASVNFTKFLENFTVNREDRNETQYLIVSFPIGIFSYIIKMNVTMTTLELLACIRLKCYL